MNGGFISDPDVVAEACDNLFRAFGAKPTEDARNQLIRVFIPCLRIMCERGYDPEGKTWREAGWRPQLYECMKKMARIKFWAWSRSKPDRSLYEVPDLINYLGFFQRGVQEEIEPWGEWGNPG